ncbi:MAG TPA: phage holin family protein [Pyrinomonadaceae bacterium]|nr:phage holin family protein [Pyrinomonadaceae bacterium]
MADMERSTAAAPARVPAGQADLESLPTLFGRLGDDVMTLLDTKLNLLKVEVKEDANAYIRAGVMIGIGATIAGIGFLLANVAIACFIASLFIPSFSLPVSYGLGFVITGVAYLIIGGIIVMVMKNRLAERDLVPDRSVEELRKDKQWLKKEI